MTKRTKQLLGILSLSIICFAIVFLIFGKAKITKVFPPSIKINKISTIILSRDEKVLSQREDLLKKVANAGNYKDIIVVWPQDIESIEVASTDKSWKINNTTINPNKDIITQLSNNSIKKVDKTSFDEADPFLASVSQNFPDSNIVPLNINPNLSRDKVLEFEKKLFEIAPKSLLVISTNGATDQFGALSEIHDSFALKILSLLDDEKSSRTDVGSPASLVLAINWAKDNETKLFHLSEKTNSGKLDEKAEENSTGYIFGWYEKGEILKTEELSFMFGGDMMLSRHVNCTFPQDKLKNVVSNLGEGFFSGTDISLVNLEGPILKDNVPCDDSEGLMTFRFPPQTIDVLKLLGINAVSLANNHSSNAGKTGVEQSHELLDSANITYIGHQSKFDETSVRRFDTGDEKISIIATNLLETDADLTGSIKNEKEAGYLVMIFPHWGNEYQAKHSKAQEQLAHEWIDAGADLVIGSHPHVIQDAEIYNKKPIFYSLGNLVFDQTWSEETQRGLILAGKITQDKVTIVLLPTISKNLKPELLEGNERLDVINQYREELGFIKAEKKDYGYDILEFPRK